MNAAVLTIDTKRLGNLFLPSYREHAASLAIVAALAATLGTAHLLDDQPAGQHTAAAQTSTLADAQRTAQQLARKERAAAYECTASSGPTAEARWITDSEYVCTRRTDGRRVIVIAGGAL